MEVDYLIAGQGLAGSVLSYQLLKSGKKIYVADPGKEISSSKIAAGLYNPVTGRRMVKTWMADAIFPYLETFYTDFEQFLHVHFLHRKPVFRPFDSVADQNYWYGQSSDEAFRNYITVVSGSEEILNFYHAPFGGFFTKMSGYVNVNLLLSVFREYLQRNNLIREETIKYEHLEITPDAVFYNGIRAKAIIFCEGYDGKLNPYFSYLPFDGTKGQILDIKIEEYTLTSIVNKGVFVLPEKNYQRVGSTYERGFTNSSPSDEGKTDIENRLNQILKKNYRIIGHKAAIRPTVTDRKPLLGRHPQHPNLIIFNGLGTKGVSLAPYFASELVSLLIEDKPLLQEADIRRFVYLYR